MIKFPDSFTEKEKRLLNGVIKRAQKEYKKTGVLIHTIALFRAGQPFLAFPVTGDRSERYATSQVVKDIAKQGKFDFAVTVARGSMLVGDYPGVEHEYENLEAHPEHIDVLYVSYQSRKGEWYLILDDDIEKRKFAETGEFKKVEGSLEAKGNFSGIIPRELFN